MYAYRSDNYPFTCESATLSVGPTEPLNAFNL